MNEMYLCMDVGGTSIKYAVLDKELNFYSRGSVPTPYQGVETYLDTLTGIFNSIEEKVQGIAMSVPGVIDGDSGICITGGNLTYVELLPLKKRMEERCHVPVSVMNDAKCAAFAEATWGALADCQDGIVLVFGTGIGGALVKDGEVHQGKHFGAGEFSWIMMHPEFDNMEAIWARRNGNEELIRLASRAKGVKQEGLTTFDVFRWAEEGDEAVLWAIDRFTKDTAWMIMNLQVIYDPERILIGGGISKQPLFLEYIRKNLKRFYSLTEGIPVPEPEIMACKYYNDANLIGALGYFLRKC